jgi:hypothetical protein
VVASSPELVEKVEFHDVFHQSFLVCLVFRLSHGDVASLVRNGVLWSKCIALIGIQNNGVNLIESSKEVPDIFGRAHGHVCESIQDEFVVRFCGEFLLEERSDDRVAFSVTNKFLACDLVIQTSV